MTRGDRHSHQGGGGDLGEEGGRESGEEDGDEEGRGEDSEDEMGKKAADVKYKQFVEECGHLLDPGREKWAVGT